tara:strand:- start:3854 stop:5326 length:1473 start_codon:yes stop_codon:yes gene_type:complete
MRQPYGRQIASTITYAHPSWFAQNDFLVVVQDVRGQGGSEGTFTGFSQESSDTSQTHSWVRSLAECNGRLGTYGFSYQGLTQLLAEPGSIPPDCLSPAMTGLNEFDHWSCDGGAFWWHLGLAWGLQLAAQKALRLRDTKGWLEIRKSLENNDYLREGPLLLDKYDPSGMANNWYQNSRKIKKSNWIIHKPLKTWLRQPMLLIGGWWDPHLRGILDIYKQSLKAGGEPELHIGPATHLNWWEGTNKLQLNFFNRHLKLSKDTFSKNKQAYFWNLTTKKWQKNYSPINNERSWGLISKGLACVESNDGILEPNSNGSGTVLVVHDPWRPVPSIGGHLGPNPGEAERNELDQRNDIAIFSSTPFPSTFHLEGHPSLEIVAFADQEGFDLCVAMSILNKERTSAKQLSTGVLRVSGEEAKEPFLRKICLYPLLADFREGESLRISIAGAAWPAIGINPGNQAHPCRAPDANCLVTTISLKLSDSKLRISPLISL